MGIPLYLDVYFVLFAVLIYFVGLPQKLRPLQVIFPIIAVVFCVVCYAIRPQISDAAESFLLSVPFINVNRQAIDMELRAVFALACLICFLLVKFVLTLLIKLIDKFFPGELLNALKGLFSFAYEWHDVGLAWSIKPNYQIMGKIIRWLYLILAVASAAIMYVTRDAIGAPAAFCPAYAVIVFAEIASFLNAKPCTEAKKKGSVEFDSNATRMSNYDKLLEAYTKFQNRIVHMSKEIGRPHRVAANHKIVTPLMESEEHEDNLAGTYLKSLQKLGNALDSDKATMLTHLLHSKNVICTSPFYWDFGKYMLFPLLRELTHGNKAMVLCGSDIRLQDVKAWLEQEMSYISGVDELWRIKSLFECDSSDELDICCMNLSDVNRQEDLKRYEDFLAKTRFVLLLNPSTSFSASQVGLGLMARTLGAGKGVTYCVCDKNTNGLVDSLSHALRAQFVEVECPHVPEGTLCSVIWRAENPQGIHMHHELFGEIAQYLGLGTEIATVAAKQGIANIVWTGHNNIPLLDVRWIAQQYYRKICKYADLDASAAAIDDRIQFRDGMWDSQETDHAFYIVEDEGSNAFEVLRRFSTRGREDAFVNVISPNYLLRDYMSENAGIFLADPKAIPHIIPDYSNSLRNITLGLFARLSLEPVPEEEVVKTLRLAGLGNGNQKASLVMLASMYLNTDADQEKIASCIVREEMQCGIDPETLRYKRNAVYRLGKGHPFQKTCKRILAHSYYVCEDEELDRNALGSCLTGHMYQNALPGQHITLDGKHYEVLSFDETDKDCRVLIRRASDHFNGRVSYRQIRDVAIEDWKTSNRLNRTRDYAGIKVERAEVSLWVSTRGYFEMSDPSDFLNAKFVALNTIPDRVYRNKEVLKISFDEELAAQSDSLATLTVLLSELFKTVYSDNACYLLVGSMAVQESDFPLGLYSRLEGSNVEEDAIYIIEDSEIDLGLIDSVDRNIIKFMGILQDYLRWHSERILCSDAPVKLQTKESDVVLNIGNDLLNTAPVETKLRLLEKIKDKLFGLGTERVDPGLGIEVAVKEKKKKKFPFGKSKDEAATVDEETAVDDVVDTEESAESKEDSPSDWKTETETVTDTQTDIASDTEAETGVGADVKTEMSGSDAEVEASAEAEAETEDSEKKENLANIRLFPRKPVVMAKADIAAYGTRPQEELSEGYKKKNFLKFGFEGYPKSLAIPATLNLLEAASISSNELRKAREDYQTQEIEKLELDADESTHVCDFCAEPLTTAEYDVLDDGCERCLRCSAEAITSLDELERVYAEVRKTMRELYKITLPPVVFKLAQADEVARNAGVNFVPTSGFDARVVGVAIKKGKNDYTLLVESGAPRISVIGTLVHELTHIWQYENWNDREIIARYGMENRLAIYEGMAVWSEIQYLFAGNNKAIAKKRLENELARQDVYGAGLRGYYKHYKIDPKPSAKHKGDSPFKHQAHPLG